jgi:uncharacterized membrane protein YidH (DUF202 family)
LPGDPGRQPERTALAWQRTALALAAGTIVVGRLTFSSAGAVAVLVVALGVGHAAVIFATAHQHYRIRTGAVRSRRWPTGVHAAILTAQATVLGLLELFDVGRR